VLAGLALSDTRPLPASRYFCPGAFFLLLIAAAAINGLRPPRWALVAGAAVLVAASVPNIANYTEQADSLREIAQTNTAARAASELIAAESGREPADPTSRDYLGAVERFGSPAGGPAGVLDGDATARAFLDASLVKASLLEVRRAKRPGEGCRTGSGTVALPNSGLHLAQIDAPALSARRFSAAFTRVPLPRPGSGDLLIRPAGEQLVRPWFVRLPQGARVCG